MAEMRAYRSGPDWIAWAPAKLNLLLEIKARRDDGYHEIETVMVPIDLYDSLRFRANTSEVIDLECTWAMSPGDRAAWLEPLPPAEENLVFRGLSLLRQRANVRRGAHVTIVKRIPSAAGLGGGSSDLACALSLANRAWQVDWPAWRLAALAAELGSDVPFFLGNRAAVCRGRGELVEPIPLGRQLHFVILKPPEGNATASVFRASRPATTPVDSGQIVRALARGNAAEVARGMMNRLQPGALSVFPGLDQIRERFQRLDVLGHQMTGSGSSYFGVCSSRRQARRLAGLLGQRGGGGVFFASSCCARSPE